MSPISRDDAVEAVRARTDIVELVGRYLKLKKAGSRYVGLCPFHAEKTPSFSVNGQKGFFYCFGCKASGDSFTFLMRMDGKTFPEALEDLAHRAGVELPARRHADPQVRERKQRLLDTLETACQFYQDQLWNKPAGQAARDYLKARGLDPALARKYRLGAAPAGWQNLSDHLKAKGVKTEDALAAGLVVRGKQNHYDLFRNRLVFPILGLDDHPHGFGARKLDPDEKGGKYINSPQGQVFDKSAILYGLDEARRAVQQKGRAILVEGYFDVLSLVGAGVAEGVATCGTSLTEGHAQILKRFADSVVTIFDGDEAGLKASFRSAEVLLAQDISPYMVALPPGEDPDSFIANQGNSKFLELLEAARPSIEVLADMLARQAGNDVEASTRATRKLLPLLGACTDGVRLSGYIRLVAERFRIDERDLRQTLNQNKARRVQSPRSRAESAPPTHDSERTERPSGPPPSKDELMLLALLIRMPQLIQTVSERGVAASVRSPAVIDFLNELNSPERPTDPTTLLAMIADDQVKQELSADLVKGHELSPEQLESDLDLRIKKIRLVALELEIGRLQTLISQAERAGNDNESRQLKTSKFQLTRELKALGLPVKRVP